MTTIFRNLTEIHTPTQRRNGVLIPRTMWMYN